MMFRRHGYFPNPATGAVGTLTAGGRVSRIARSLICIAILSKSADVMAPESPEILLLKSWYREAWAIAGISTTRPESRVRKRKSISS